MYGLLLVFGGSDFKPLKAARNTVPVIRSAEPKRNVPAPYDGKLNLLDALLENYAGIIYCIC